MQAPVLVVDALWRCLCPSFSRRSLCHATGQYTRRRKLHSYGARGAAYNGETPTWGRSTSKVPEHLVATSNPSQSNPIDLSTSFSEVSRPKSDFSKPLSIQKQEHIRRIAAARQEEYVLDEDLVAGIFARLEQDAATADKPRVQKDVIRLVQGLGQNPDGRIYRALLLAEADPKHGSAGEVERLLQQADVDGVALDSSIYHAALKALAIHPNYILRERILTEMERRWLDLDASGWHHVICALFREAQIELALGRLSAMRTAGHMPPAWLLHFGISMCISIHSFPEALALLKYRATYSEPIPSAVWSFCLDSAAHELSHPLVDYVWRRAIEASYLNPSSGTCVAVLDTASRHGNFRLASDVFRVLGNRASPLETHHYEALMQSYLRAGDLASGVAVLQLMRRAGCPVEPGTVHILMRFLAMDAPTRVPYCLALLSDSTARPTFESPRKEQAAHSTTAGSWAPAPVLSACIEALIWTGAVPAALAVYRSWDAYHGFDKDDDDEMHNHGPQPRAPPSEAPLKSTYDQLLVAIRRLPEHESELAAREIRDDMRRRGMEPLADANTKFQVQYVQM